MRHSIFNIYQTYDSQSNSDVLGMKLGVRYYIENKLSRCILHNLLFDQNTHDQAMYDITKKRLVVTNLNTTLSEKKQVDISGGWGKKERDMDNPTRCHQLFRQIIINSH